MDSSEEDCMWDLDFYPLSKDIPDPFLDIINESEYKSIQKTLWKERLEIIDIYNQPFGEKYLNKIDIDLIWIYSRRAFDKRNNLEYDNNNRLINSISSYIVYLSTNFIQNKNKENNLNNKLNHSKEIK